MRNPSCFLFFIFLTFFTNYLQAQDNYLDQPIGWRGNQIELHTITDKPKQLACTFVMGPDSIRAFVTDNQLQIVQQFGLVRLPKEQLLGGFFGEGRMYLFIENGTYGELHRYELNIATGTVTDKWIHFDVKDEKVVERFNGGDRFLYFTVDKKNSEFVIYDFNQPDTFATMRYNFGEGVWHDLTNGGLFKRSIDVEKIDLEGECSLEAAIEKNKLYLQNDALLLVMNNHVDSTQVFNFDLQQKKVNSWLIQHGSGAPFEGNFVSYNSFLLRDKLYYVRATLETLLLEVVDVYSGKAVKTFVANKEDTVSFKNTSIIQEGSAYNKKSERELGKTSQLLRKMVNGEAVIIATPHSTGQIQLTVGSFTKVSGGGGGGGFTYMPGIGGYGSGGGMWMPSGGFSRSASWIKSARFKTLLNGTTYEHTDGDTDRSINEKIEQYTDQKSIPPHAENLYMINGHYYHAYYDKTGRRLVILEF